MNEREAVWVCSQCKRATRHVENTVVVRERKGGELTGRKWRLCRDCDKEFYRREIKNLQDTVVEGTLKTLGLTLFDVRDGLTDWNKSK